MTQATTDQGKKRILVADDEPSVREFVTRALTHAGYEVTAVEDGNRALQALSEQSYDLLLTDIVMPDLDGISLALSVANDYPDIKILMMTGYTDQRERAHNLDCLVDEIITKPFTLDDITDVVHKALA